MIWETLIELRENLTAIGLEELHIVDIIGGNVDEVIQQAKSRYFEDKIFQESSQDNRPPRKIQKAVKKSRNEPIDFNPFAPIRENIDFAGNFPPIKPPVLYDQAQNSENNKDQSSVPFIGVLLDMFKGNKKGDSN